MATNMHMADNILLSEEVLLSEKVLAVGKVCVGSGDVEKLQQLCVHRKCISGSYAGHQKVRRFDVPLEFCNWSVQFAEYSPQDWTDPSVLGKDGKAPVWADPEDAREVDFSRRAIYGKIHFHENGRPINPVGRTGITGRGLLGKWGPNSAADPLFTRWKRDEEGKLVFVDGVQVLQVAIVKRKDTNEWALPGGMVDYGEEISVAARREFGEEALAGNTPEEIKEITDKLKEMMDTQGVILYQGYVDDPRNTDNAWMVTTCFWVHDKTGDVFGKYDLQGDEGETNGAVWKDIFPDLNMYASHADWVRAAHDRAVAQNKQATAIALEKAYQGSWAICVGAFIATRDPTILKEWLAEAYKSCASETDWIKQLLTDLFNKSIEYPSSNERDDLMAIGEVVCVLIRQTDYTKAIQKATAFRHIWNLCAKKFIARGNRTFLFDCFQEGSKWCVRRPYVDSIIASNELLLTTTIASKFPTAAAQLMRIGECIARVIENDV